MEVTAANRLDAASGAGGVEPEVVVTGACDAFGRVAGLVEALLAEFAGLPLEDAGRGVLRNLVEALGRVRAGADAAEARAVNALDALGDGGVDAVEVLRRNTGSSQREARRRRRRAGTLGEMPNVAGALAVGDISPEHADALARAAGATSAEAVDGDTELLAQVAAVPADRAGRHIQRWTQRNQDPADLHEQHLRQRRRRRLHFGDGDDGMFMAHAAFDRVLGAQFRSLINGIADRIWRAEGGRENPDGRSVEQRRLDALAVAVGLQPGPPNSAQSDGPAVGEQPAGASGSRRPSRSSGGPATRAGGLKPATRAGGLKPVSGDGAPAAGSRGDGAPGAGSRGDGAPGAGSRGDGAPGAGSRGDGAPGAGSRGDGAPGAGSRGDGAPGAGSRGDGATRPLSLRHQVVVVASADLVSGKDPQGRCEIPGVGPIPQTELERLACGAELFGVLFSGEGEPLWHGRGERAATDAQRRALVARDGGCVLCAAEPAWCEAHHVVPWAKPTEGPTDIDNLALLCSACHHRLHDHNRVLTRSTDGSWGTEPDPRQAGRGATRHRRTKGGGEQTVGGVKTEGGWQACRAGPRAIRIDVSRWVRSSDRAVDPGVPDHSPRDRRFPDLQGARDVSARRSGGRRIAGARKASGGENAGSSVVPWVRTPRGRLPRSPPPEEPASRGARLPRSPPSCRRRIRRGVSRRRCPATPG